MVFTIQCRNATSFIRLYWLLIEAGAWRRILLPCTTMCGSSASRLVHSCRSSHHSEGLEAGKEEVLDRLATRGVCIFTKGSPNIALVNVGLVRHAGKC